MKGNPTVGEKARLRKKNLIKVYDVLELARRRLLYDISPVLLVQYLSLKTGGRLFHPGRARTFEDKLRWLMLYWREPLKTRCTDKYAVRIYVSEHGLDRLLPELLGVYGSSVEIDFASLPEKFVLKCTHGSGFNLLCRDKARFDVAGARKKLDRWMKTDISKINGEVHYAPIRPRIICETFLGDPAAGSINDYKIHCFHGRPHCTMVCSERDPETRKSKFDYYDVAWEHKLPYCRPGLSTGRDIPKPDAYAEMIEAARELSAPFPFVRVDLYSFRGKVVFGEMTFTPNGCVDIDLTDLAQNTMGDLIVLPAKRLL
jgi:hypothetical protein